MHVKIAEVMACIVAIIDAYDALTPFAPDISAHQKLIISAHPRLRISQQVQLVAFVTSRRLWLVRFPLINRLWLLSRLLLLLVFLPHYGVKECFFCEFHLTQAELIKCTFEL